jgi:hypothetical protein
VTNEKVGISTMKLILGTILAGVAVVAFGFPASAAASDSTDSVRITSDSVRITADVADNREF